MVDKTPTPQSPGQTNGSADSRVPTRDAARPAMVKPSGPMTYTVQKGANIIPSWQPNGAGMQRKAG
jgi:hypothetical protein